MRLKCTKCGFAEHDELFNPGREGSWDCPKCGHKAEQVVPNPLPSRSADRVKARARSWIVIQPDNTIKAVAGNPESAMQVMRTLAFPGRNALDAGEILKWTREAQALGWRCAPALVKEIER